MMKVRRFQEISLLVIVALLVSMFAVVSPVYAATEDRAIQGEGSQTQGTYVGGAADFTNLNSNDDATTYLMFADFTTQYHCYDMQSFSTGHTSITKVTITYRHRKANTYTSSLTPYVRISGTNYYGTETLTTFNTWVTTTYDWTTNPSTGTAWTSTTLNAAEFGLKSIAGFATTNDVTYMKITVDYVPTTVPTASTVAASSILSTSATLNGTIDSLGGYTNCTNYGFVWGTTSVPVNPGNVAPAAAGYGSNWSVGAGGYATGAYSHATGAVLAAGTTYYFRYAAYNLSGWAYGSELNFTTMNTPSASLQAATSVTSTTARLNGTVVNDGGQNCDVRFGYGNVTAANVAAYAHVTAWVNNTYATGSFPYVDVTSLTTSKTYYFRMAVKNDIGTVETSELTFTTSSGVSAPTGFTSIPTATSASLSWVKGTGALYTLVRYSTSTYPNTTSAGISIYLGVGSSYMLSGLTSGTTYYFSAWGFTGGVYSSSYTTTVTTASAYTPGGSSFETPKTSSSWVQTPSETKISGLPVLPGLVESNSDAYGVPLNMIWYFLWIIFAAGTGIVLYNKSNYNLTLTIGVTALIMGAGAALGLTMLWILAGFLIVAGGFAFFGERR